MTTRLLPLVVNGVELQVEAEVPPGTELTATPAELAGRASDMFVRAQSAIIALAEQTVASIGEMVKRAAAPDRVEVNFGLKFSAEGGVIFAKAAGEASLEVKLAYDRPYRLIVATEHPDQGGPGQ